MILNSNETLFRKISFTNQLDISDHMNQIIQREGPKLNYLTHEDGHRYGMDNCLIDEGIRDVIWNCRCRPRLYQFQIT